MADVTKLLMRTFGGLNVALYRASKGRVMGKARGMPVLLLTVKGRKTGSPHTTPVVYLDLDGSYLVAGSAGGSPKEPQWFRNLRATDTATIEIGDRRIAVDVAVADQDRHAELWKRLTDRAPFFSGYQDKTERQIPLATLTPRSS